MARKIRIDMTGLRFGRLTGMAFDHRGPSGHAHWLFECDCGRRVVAASGNVRSGSTASCGCLHRELSAARLTEHGHRAQKRHGPTYRAWQGMRREAGGHLCPRWQDDFRLFLADLGQRPEGARLARRDNRVWFAADNCYWAALETRAMRASRGWHKRRAALDQGAVERAPTSQSRSSPAAASISRVSMAR